MKLLEVVVFMVDKIDSFLDEVSSCTKCLEMTKGNQDCSLINFYQDKDFRKEIPSIWTDWYRRIPSSLMIIGQDWGPFKAMQDYHKKYKEEGIPFDEVIDMEKSLTKRNLEKFLTISALHHSISFTKEDFQKVYITNAILCARQGDYYRGDTIKLKECSLFCSSFLKKQIELSKPKVICTLGYYPLLALSSLYSISLLKTLSKTIEAHPYYDVDGLFIIPLYHPAAQVKGEIQLKQYDIVWEKLGELNEKNIDA